MGGVRSSGASEGCQTLSVLGSSVTSNHGNVDQASQARATRPWTANETWDRFSIRPRGHEATVSPITANEGVLSQYIVRGNRRS